MYREQGELGGLSQVGRPKDTTPVVQENGFPLRNGIYSRKNMCIYMAYYKYLSIPIEMCKHTNVKACSRISQAKETLHLLFPREGKNVIVKK